MSDPVNSLADFAAMLGCEVAEVGRMVYKATECGASIKFSDVGVNLHTIIEGSDIELDSSLLYPFTQADYDAAVTELEEEADRLWNKANNPADYRFADDPVSMIRDDDGYDYDQRDFDEVYQIDPLDEWRDSLPSDCRIVTVCDDTYHTLYAAYIDGEFCSSYTEVKPAILVAPPDPIEG